MINNAVCDPVTVLDGIRYHAWCWCKAFAKDCPDIYFLSICFTSKFLIEDKVETDTLGAKDMDNRNFSDFSPILIVRGKYNI